MVVRPPGPVGGKTVLEMNFKLRSLPGFSSPVLVNSETSPDCKKQPGCCFGVICLAFWLMDDQRNEIRSQPPSCQLTLSFLRFPETTSMKLFSLLNSGDFQENIRTVWLFSHHQSQQEEFKSGATTRLFTFHYFCTYLIYLNLSIFVLFANIFVLFSFFFWGKKSKEHLSLVHAGGFQPLVQFWAPESHHQADLSFHTITAGC